MGTDVVGGQVDKSGTVVVARQDFPLSRRMYALT